MRAHASPSPLLRPRPAAPRSGRWIPPLLVALAISACADRPGPTAPPDDGAATARTSRIVDRPGTEPLKVMSRNVYLGADIGPIFTVDFTNPAEVAAVAGQIWATVLATDFTRRAEALADEIGRARPHVVGLQEVARFRARMPGVPAPFLVLDFAEILEAALAARGLGYDRVEIVDNTRVELPAATPTGLVFVDFTDRDAVLVRSDVPRSGVAKGNYGATFAVGPVLLERGWIRLDVAHRGVGYHLFNTHLEVQGLAPIQALQLAELRALLAGVAEPTVLLGDLNSDAAAGPGAPSWTPTYETLIEAGWVDAWRQAAGPERDGFTCCFDPTLMDAADPLTERLDFVLLRDRFEPVKGRVPGSIKAEVVGEAPGDRVSGLWPSDHAGVLVALRLPGGLLGR